MHVRLKKNPQKYMQEELATETKGSKTSLFILIFFSFNLFWSFKSKRGQY